jgi:hypothetical protein
MLTSLILPITEGITATSESGSVIAPINYSPQPMPGHMALAVGEMHTHPCQALSMVQSPEKCPQHGRNFNPTSFPLKTTAKLLSLKPKPFMKRRGPRSLWPRQRQGLDLGENPKHHIVTLS